MKGLNPAQTGKAGELRFASLVILGSRGQIELVPPLADDERRDFELHLKHRFRHQLSVQVKCVTKLVMPYRELDVHFLHGSRRPIDPAYWFFAGYLDLATLDFADPLFLIPSSAMRRGRRVINHACPSLAKNARDRYRKYRVTRRQLGGRLVQILEHLDAGARQAAA